jgi:hypothetical protein
MNDTLDFARALLKGTWRPGDRMASYAEWKMAAEDALAGEEGDMDRLLNMDALLEVFLDRVSPDEWDNFGLDDWIEEEGGYSETVRKYL